MADPFAQYVPPAPPQLGPAPLTARQMLDWPIPNLQVGNEQNPSESSRVNLHFYAPDTITYNHHQMFTNYGGYPNNLNIARTYWPLNDRQVGVIAREAQAVDAGRHYVLAPASFVLDEKIRGNEYCVESKITGSVPDLNTGQIRQYEGFVDAVWRAPTSLNNDQNPFAMCEFKRPGCIRPAWWP